MGAGLRNRMKTQRNEAKLDRTERRVDRPKPIQSPTERSEVGLNRRGETVKLLSLWLTAKGESSFTDFDDDEGQ